ncbi:hypothetical protein EGN72_17090 [Pseudorhodobacter sp. E13]|uniref:hypothetical protein n=1 Tax=Pseudorhodobacter sp. E13 TaxID=2487931 RepID=UPI000F8F69EC|nr:hypothetical protein [Pseudorhodobacter sp. E13]RUS58651.1 hypothetical protein EGN72_17090 [Pseudorhodobacter sp. E13]
MASLCVYFIVFAAILDPDSLSAASRRKARRVAAVFRYLGAVLLLCAAGAFLYAVQGVVFAGKAPDTPVSVAEFSETSLTGTLGEAVLDGYVQLDALSKVNYQIERARIGGYITLFPLTGADWQPGDPVKTFVTMPWIAEARTLEQYAQALVKEGLPPGSTGAVAQTRLAVKARMFGFNGDLAPTLRAAGLNVTDQAYALEFIDNRRAEKLQKAFAGPRMIAMIFGVMGLVLLLIDFGARRSLARFED